MLEFVQHASVLQPRLGGSSGGGGLPWEDGDLGGSNLLFNCRRSHDEDAEEVGTVWGCGGLPARGCTICDMVLRDRELDIIEEEKEY